MDDHKSSGQFPLPGIALVLLALGVFVVADNPFNSTRTATLQDLTDAYRKQSFKESILEAKGKKLDDEIPDSEHKYCQYRLAERINKIIEDIHNIREGSFVPIAQHPIFSAIAMPFGGVGGLYLIDYMANFGL